MAQLTMPRVRILDDPPSFIPPQEELRLQIGLLLEENSELKSRLSAVEDHVQALASRLQTSQATSPVQTSPAEGPSHSPAQAGPAGDEAQAEEAGLRQDLAWLDEPCGFQKACGRTWRQMAENYGDKIPMNGRGPQPPRAYLHSIENWQTAYLSNRLKAKVALELCKQG